MKKTQIQMVMQHMKSVGGITPVDAFMNYGILRLSARIKNLRDSGHKIKTEIVKTKSKQYARYVLCD